MSDAWGGSWAEAWGGSWGADGSVVVPPTPSVIRTRFGEHKRRKKRPRDFKDRDIEVAVALLLLED